MAKPCPRTAVSVHERAMDLTRLQLQRRACGETSVTLSFSTTALRSECCCLSGFTGSEPQDQPPKPALSCMLRYLAVRMGVSDSEGTGRAVSSPRSAGTCRGRGPVVSWPTPSPPTQVDSALAQAAAQQKEERRPSSRKDEDFPGSAGVKTLCLRCRVHRFDPWSGKFRMATVRGRGPPSKKKQEG